MEKQNQDPPRSQDARIAAAGAAHRLSQKLVGVNRSAKDIAEICEPVIEAAIQREVRHAVEAFALKLLAPSPARGGFQSLTGVFEEEDFSTQVAETGAGGDRLAGRVIITDDGATFTR